MGPFKREGQLVWRDMRDYDQCATARGVVLGLAIGLAMWVIIGAIVAAVLIV